MERIEQATVLNEKGLEAAAKAMAADGYIDAMSFKEADVFWRAFKIGLTTYLSASALEAPEDVAGVEPVAWKWRLKWEPDKWYYAAKVAFSPHVLEHAVTDLTPLYPASALARVAAERDEARKDAQFMTDNRNKWQDAATVARNEASTLRARIAELEAKVERAGEVISFYADKANWWNDETSVNRQELFDVPMGDDLGDRARRYVEEGK